MTQINVLEYFEQGALTRCRDKVAVTELSQHYTFNQVEQLSKRCANTILKRTRAVNQPIAVLLPKGAGTIVADLGVLYSGNCYANLDIKSPPERLKTILRNLGACLVITSAAHVPDVSAAE